MTRRRAPERDYICRRCGCACHPYPGKHLGGGSRGMKACRGPSVPVLRAEFHAGVTAVVAELRRRSTGGVLP